MTCQKAKNSSQQSHQKVELNAKDDSCVASVGVLMAFQLVIRLLTFGLNTAILRLSSPLVLSVASVKLDLFISTSLYLARDGVRMAMMRYEPKGLDERETAKRYVQMSWLSMAIGLAVCLALGLLFASNPPSEISGGLLPLYHRALLVYAGSTMIELASEPILSYLIYKQQTYIRLRIELVSLVARMLCVLLFILCNGRLENPADELALGMRAFSCGQLLRSAMLALGLVLAARRHPVLKSLTFLDYLPLRRHLFDTLVLIHACEMTKQLFLKYCLAQGDMWIVGIGCSLTDQAVYAVVVNYGSLLCRLLLQPMEESALHFWTRSSNDQEAMYSHLLLALKFDMVLAMLFVLVAPWYTSLIVRCLLGARWLSTPMPGLLALYCMQLAPMAFCGILEAFMNATMSPTWYGRAKAASVCLSAAYVVSAYLLVGQFGAAGLSLSSILSFSMRAGLGWIYLRSSYLPAKVRITFRSILPSYFTCTSILICAVFSCIASRLGHLASLLVGLASAPIILLFIFKFDGDVLRLFKRQTKSIKKSD